jgi:very-long-chain enoyl-CoA reductase
MASDTINLVIKPRGKPIKSLPASVTSSPDDIGSQLHEKIGRLARCSPHRLRITKGSDGSVVPNARDSTVGSTGLKNDSVIYVKDLGPQIAWRTVFLVEYLGPLLIHPAFYLLRPYIYPYPTLSGNKSIPPPSDLQKLSLLLILLHFGKRELETLFVHRFSASTMPLRNIFKNSAHYWLLSGVYIAYWTYAPNSPTQTGDAHSPVVYLGVALFAIAQLANLNTHLVLRNLRTSGTTERGIPRGLGFSWVTCPNYLFEILAWLAIWIVNGSLSTAVFAIVAGAQMAAWARKKERRYRKEFGDRYKKKRFSMLPGIV